MQKKKDKTNKHKHELTSFHNPNWEKEPSHARTRNITVLKTKKFTWNFAKLQIPNSLYQAQKRNEQKNYSNDTVYVCFCKSAKKAVDDGLLSFSLSMAGWLAESELNTDSVYMQSNANRVKSFEFEIFRREKKIIGATSFHMRCSFGSECTVLLLFDARFNSIFFLWNRSFLPFSRFFDPSFCTK